MCEKNKQTNKQKKIEGKMAISSTLLAVDKKEKLLPVTLDC